MYVSSTYHDQIVNNIYMFCTLQLCATFVNINEYTPVFIIRDTPDFFFIIYKKITVHQSVELTGAIWLLQLAPFISVTWINPQLEFEPESLS